ncbi:MAG: ABC transporter permease subunit [Oscillospiraceae bacterium]|nr:ABC transporter permease subunit [Oscillospiraceae bacterium]
MKILTSEEKTVVFKDFGDIWENKTARSILFLVPFMMTLVLPVFFLILLFHVPSDQIKGMEQMLQLLPAQAADLNGRQSVFYLVTNLIFPMFFLMIPLTSASICAASSFILEKERGTLETLLLTPLSVKRVFKAKVLGGIFLSALTTAVSFLLFSIVMAVGDLLLSMPFYLNWNWLVLFFFLSPVITVFSVLFMALTSAKSVSNTESFQTSGYLVLPIVLLFMGQFTGLYQVNAILLLWISGILFAADLVLCFFSVRLFTAEKLLR